ncbi:WD40 repeat domain-containing protein [Phormidium sp. CCY1219]|uniref:WD40 repeat domain-containing protein n=1 Tax=Phormidium sp. CCY1219 TaxID=2886104 RepID=UPI002D1F33F5|nr:hypothetical protein [Phormidium sp. CCY1219]MEB3826977.1 hypothetical protein [Phormidium sp. CCY1219]
MFSALGASAIAISRDGQLLGCGCHNGTIGLWRLKDRQQIGKFTPFNSRIEAMAFSPKKLVIATVNKNGNLYLLDIQTEHLRFLGIHPRVNAIAFSPDGENLASASSDGTIKLWQVKRSLELCILKGYGEDLLSVTFSPDGQTIASGTYQKIHLWQLRKGLGLDILLGHQDWVTAVIFSQDGREMVSSSEDGMIKIWRGD